VVVEHANQQDAKLMTTAQEVVTVVKMSFMATLADNKKSFPNIEHMLNVHF
jgi:hypothetical protein